MFVDLVNSTEFKKDHPEPDWILRIKLFVNVISKYAKELGGDVVKIIGDEVMITFNRDEMINDATSFIMRVSEIETALKRITKFETQIKIALDTGPVCFLKYDGHDAPDPQGVPVDRCARIAKFCKASTILTSEVFFSKSEIKDLWHFVGKPLLKGIGNVSVYQFKEANVKAEDSISVPKSRYTELCNSEKERDLLKEMNVKLQKQCNDAGVKPNIKNSVDTGKESAWQKIKDSISDIKELIKKADISNYPRFLFLNQIGEGEEYNKFTGKTFDDAIEGGYVELDDNERYFTLNSNHKRNQKINYLLSGLQKKIDDFVEDFGALDEDDLFEYSIRSPEFWDKYIGYNVK
jgi:class 3 adenylate cyclase